MDGGQDSLSQRIVQEYNLFLIPRTKKKERGEIVSGIFKINRGKTHYELQNVYFTSSSRTVLETWCNLKFGGIIT